VQTNEVCGGSQAVAIENASVSHEFIGGKTNVWVSYRLTMARGGAPKTIPDNVAVAFFVNSDGHLCVYNGRECVVMPTIVPDGWNRFDFHFDYTTRRWDLRFNREPVVSDFEFYGTPSSFSLMRLDVNGSASSFMDDIHVLFENPDSDGDGYSNEEEIQGGSNPESADSIPVSEASVSGTIIYEGAETGTIHVIAVTDSNAWDSSVNIQLVEPGAYSITVPVMTEVWIKAWVDSDGDGCRNVGEAQGAYGPVSLRWPKTGSDLTLSIPDSDNDGLSDAFELSGKIYQAIPGAFTWEEAEADAERLGGHLATITSEQEENILVQCVGYQAFYDNHLWLGASDIDGDGQWSWITGEPFDYTRWCDGSMASWAEGHPLAGANRAMMYHRWFTRSNNGQYWYDVGKNNRYGYLLEMTVTLDPHSNDTDGDGVSDFDEIRSGGNPTLVDTDGDGFTDGEEVAAGTSPAQLDTDFDGLTDVEELAGPTDPLNPDTDGDGLMDGPEVYGHIYYPVYEMLHWHGAKTHAESLGGHLATVTSEAEHKNIIRTLGTTVMNRYNFWLGASDEALEGDWCWVTGESFDYSRWYRTGSVMAPDNGSNLNLGMDEDYLEYFRGGIYQWNDINKSLWRPYIMEIDALLDPLNPDCDNDGIQDGDEIAKGMNPLSLDSDGDGLSDAYEIAHGLNGAIADSDFDGLNDGDEIALGTDPLNPDSDGDGLLDGEEHFITLTDPLSGMDAELSAFIPGVLGYNRELFHASNEYIEDGNDLIVASLIYNPSVTWTITNNTAGMYRLALQLDPYEKDEDEYFRYPVEVSINGNVIGEMLAVTNRGDLAEGFVYTPWLKPGIYEVKCRFKWFMQPATQDVRVHALELYPINGADSNQDGIQDWVQARLDSGMDSDGDGINDKDELFTLGTDLLKADTDGDGMTDHDEITLGTDPVERDTDGDGIDDWTEKNQALTDPLAADFGARTDEVSLNGSQITASVGNWIKEGSMIYSVGLNGSLTYVMNVPSAGHYAVEFEIADHSAFPESDPFDLTLAVDGTSGRSVAKPIPKGQLVSVLFFAPYLTAGEHSFNLLWSNLNSSQMLEVRNVRLVSYAGTDADGNGQSDWADTREANAFNLLETGFSSPVSPVCIEGSSLFVDLLSISNSFALTDVSNHWVHAQKSLEKGWYANAGLNPWDETEISFVHNGKSRPQSLALNWDETNLMNTPTNQVTVRLGDALLFNSMPTNENQGSIIITVNGPSGSTNLISLTDLPVPVLFDEPGTYTVSGFFSKSRAVSFNTNDPVNAYGFRNGHAANGVYNNGNTSTSSVFTVNVVDIHFNGNPSCVKDSERFWDCPDISTNAVIEQDAALAVQRYSLGDDGTRFWLYSSSEEEKCMIARLTANGPITAHALINTVTEAYGEFFRTVEEFADGSNLIELTLAYGNIPDDFRIVIEIFAGGITFLDGTVEKEFTKSDFNEQGVLKVLMVQSAGKVNDCHRVKIFQGDHQL
jgi:hypothetical protein